MRIFITVLLLLMFTDAVAYLDPGTGSMLLQVILGGIAISTIFTVFVIPSILIFAIRMEKPNILINRPDESS